MVSIYLWVCPVYGVGRNKIVPGNAHYTVRVRTHLARNGTFLFGNVLRYVYNLSSDAVWP